MICKVVKFVNEFPMLGIMVCKERDLFLEKGFYKTLQKLGQQHELSVYVFYPNYVDWGRKIVKGFQYNFNSKIWEIKNFPLPNYVYDRCFFTSSKNYLTYKPYIKLLRQNKEIEFLGVGLNGKWEVYNILSKHSVFQQYLPKTNLYKNDKQLDEWLPSHPVILKPVGGTHGKGVIRISKSNNAYEIIGRDLSSKKIYHFFNNRVSLCKWVSNFTYKRRYLIQQYLTLTTSNNNPFDIRVLVQKNSNGKWEITGSGARVGPSSNITSNLHSGSSVQPTNLILTKEFGVAKAEKIIKEIYEIASTLPSYLESKHGNLVELGLDMGVDKQGKVWIIEVNSKPGRQVFALLNNKTIQYKSVIQPLLYANYLKQIDK